MSMLQKLFGVTSAASEVQRVNEPTTEEKRKAAMVLNLCATSISRILSSNDMEVMDVEYETILNNLNLQNMLKDEALLSTFKSILDTITFYRLQAGDKKRSEARYRQKLNNAIWSSSSQGACILFASASNPTPWAVVSGAIMAVGAFCNVKRAKAEASVSYEDEKWRLERSLIEQLHALCYSLFETSWRLSDRYNFEDAWRLTSPQIEQYNSILLENDPAWRYFKLLQYKENFEAYPYFWNELGESAFLASLAARSADEKQSFLKNAEDAFAKFMAVDMKLLREDMIGAAARLRLVQIQMMRFGSWDKALKENPAFASDIRKMACAAPDLLIQGAICLATAYEETKDKCYLSQSIGLMELVVCQDYNIPTSTRLLSKLYLESAEFDGAYQRLADRIGAGGVIAKGDTTGASVMSVDGEEVKDRLKQSLSKQFELALKLSNDGLFNDQKNGVDARIGQFISEKGLRKDSSVKDMLTEVWAGIRSQLNEQFLLVSSKLGIEPKRLVPLAQEINREVTKQINAYDGTLIDLFSSSDRAIQQHRSINKMIANANELFVSGVFKVVIEGYSIDKHEDIEAIGDGVSAIERAVAQSAKRNGVAIASQQKAAQIDLFTMSVSDGVDGCAIEWVKYQEDPAWGERMMDEKKSFRVNVDALTDVIPASHRLEEELERKGYRVRVYTQGSAVAIIYPPLGAAWSVYTLAHRLMTINPDYEVIRYPKSVEVRYMHDDIHDTADDVGSAGKLYDDVKHDVCGFGRVLSESWERVRGIFS